ncbi:hypothetical protein NFX31_01970 [Microbacterium azadirachtae]|uniref:Uncharacterized protein n=1 Tax=Microbacterium azadirachtae TaxID=582680 RepID=A0A0F0L328_9MICO|nr:hypothetical protein [Microbacterium azadirachtae]KJL26755.1 hypothetical protein RL72_00811 [Microbacterium azadirachtae]UXW86334.1 hypothetical protein NFX31_01970 [Microbacterium azadirachtae]
MTDQGQLPWELDYDAAQFVEIPYVDATDAEGADVWIGTVLDRYGIRPDAAPGPAEQIAATARMMLGNARPGAARLWFAPPGIYSDLLVSIAVESSADRPDTEELFAGATSSTAVDVTPLRTETHGAGYIVRWGVFLEDGTEEDGAEQDGTLVAQWTVLLNDGTWTILMDVLGTTLPAFLLFEQQLPQLIVGVRVPGAVVR